MNDKRVRVVISGHVQGVGFRISCQREAERLGIAGWIRNRWDGGVEAHFEGPADSVDGLVRWCYHGPPAAHVLGVEVHDAPPGGPLHGFHVRSSGDD
jgi:acylphosphatase